MFKFIDKISPKIWFCIACALIFLCVVLSQSKRTETIVKTETKTVIKFDTIVIEKPVEVARWYEKQVKMVIKDTIRVHDTLYMYLNREIRTYVGDEYRAQVSGIDPQLDRIEVYPKTVTNTITNTIEKSKWHGYAEIGLMSTANNPVIPTAGFKVETPKRLSFGLTVGIADGHLAYGGTLGYKLF